LSGPDGSEPFFCVCSFHKVEIVIRKIGSDLDQQGTQQGRECGEGVPQPEPSLRLSAGVASYRGQETVDQLLGRADRALYRAKTGGRNRVCREDQ
jgi:GGDEF domain-containing protein